MRTCCALAVAVYRLAFILGLDFQASLLLSPRLLCGHALEFSVSAKLQAMTAQRGYSDETAGRFAGSDVLVRRALLQVVWIPNEPSANSVRARAPARALSLWTRVCAIAFKNVLTYASTADLHAFIRHCDVILYAIVHKTASLQPQHRCSMITLGFSSSSS